MPPNCSCFLSASRPYWALSFHLSSLIVFKITNEEPLSKKVLLSETDFKVMARVELILRWKQYEALVQALEGKHTDLT